jgi:D-glycero-D-manno-heptose 1,7-bisphosphate phosphatase
MEADLAIDRTVVVEFGPSVSGDGVHFVATFPGELSRIGINAALQARLGLDEVCVCPHDDADNCTYRKPKPGLLPDAARRWKVDLARSFMIGDRRRDIEEGQAVGCRTVFVDYGYAERRPNAPDMVARSLAAVAPDIIAALERT